jgi:MoaA/NifB/PqqE/SkfB family radical SAM enzyme
MSWLEKSSVLWRHFKFYLSRELDYPLVEPDMLQLCFLFRCNLRCKMCNVQEKYEKLKHPGQAYELDFETIKCLIEQAADMGIKQIFLLGGEPFLREDLFDIIKFAHNYKMVTVVSTNATLLGDSAIIERILDSKLHSLGISIDGACENTYKNIRGEGIFEKIRNNIQLINKFKKDKGLTLPSINISCTVMNQNIEELIDIVNLAHALEVDGICFQPVVMDNTDQGLRNNPNLNWIPASRYSLLDKSIDKLSNKDNFKFIYTGLTQLSLIKDYFKGSLTLNKQKCYAGFNRIIISQDGKLYFCAKEPDKGDISFGNIHEDRLKDLWYSHKARVFRKSIKKCGNHCLLSCNRRNEFDSLIDDFYYDHFYKRFGRFIENSSSA